MLVIEQIPISIELCLKEKNIYSKVINCIENNDIPQGKKIINSVVNSKWQLLGEMKYNLWVYVRLFYQCTTSSKQYSIHIKSQPLSIINITLY